MIFDTGDRHYFTYTVHVHCIYTTLLNFIFPQRLDNNGAETSTGKL